MIRFIKSLFCKHTDRFVRNIYGDEINVRPGRAEWWCVKCGHYRYTRDLVTTTKEPKE